MDVVGEQRNQDMPHNYAELLDRAKLSCAEIIRSSRDVIRHKFELGRLVRVVLGWHGNKNSAVEALAAELSTYCDKTILPQRLYEAARFYEAFGGKIERVWALEARLSQPLNYTYLVRRVIPLVSREQAWNPEEWQLYQERQLGCLERAVQQIEELAYQLPASVPSSTEWDGLEGKRSPTLANTQGQGDEPAALAGFLTVCQQSTSYQSFSEQVLVGTLHRTALQLREKSIRLTEEQRQLLVETILILQDMADCVTESSRAQRPEVCQL